MWALGPLVLHYNNEKLTTNEMYDYAINFLLSLDIIVCFVILANVL